jgi:hypothetical protein
MMGTHEILSHFDLLHILARMTGDVGRALCAFRREMNFMGNMRGMVGMLGRAITLACLASLR